jgi:hypothetical protein
MRFMHWRRKDADGNINNYGGATIAFDVEDDVLYFTAAMCSRKDRFCKAQGRLIASGRLRKALENRGDKMVTTMLNGRKPVEVIREFLNISHR